MCLGHRWQDVNGFPTGQTAVLRGVKFSVKSSVLLVQMHLQCELIYNWDFWSSFFFFLPPPLTTSFSFHCFRVILFAKYGDSSFPSPLWAGMSLHTDDRGLGRAFLPENIHGSRAPSVKSSRYWQMRHARLSSWVDSPGLLEGLARFCFASSRSCLYWGRKLCRRRVEATFHPLGWDFSRFFLK